MFNFFEHGWLSVIKVRLVYWWWIVKYRGKNNIPAEVIFGKLEHTLAALKDNLAKAQQAIPLADLSEEERVQLREAMMKVRELQSEVSAIAEDAEKK